MWLYKAEKWPDGAEKCRFGEKSVEIFNEKDSPLKNKTAH